MASKQKLSMVIDNFTLDIYFNIYSFIASQLHIVWVYLPSSMIVLWQALLTFIVDLNSPEYV